MQLVAVIRSQSEADGLDLPADGNRRSEKLVPSNEAPESSKREELLFIIRERRLIAFPI